MSNIKTVVKTINSTLAFVILSITSVNAYEQKSIEELLYHAMLAEASYVDFNEGEDDGTFAIKLEKSGKYANDNKREIFTNRFRLLHHLPNQILTGFSATVFENKDTDEIIFASRGSAGFLDFVVADGIGIVGSGVPKDQVVDLYNYVQRLKAPKDGKYDYIGPSLFRPFWLSKSEAFDGAGHSDWFQT